MGGLAIEERVIMDNQGVEGRVTTTCWVCGGMYNDSLNVLKARYGKCRDCFRKLADPAEIDQLIEMEGE